MKAIIDPGSLRLNHHPAVIYTKRKQNQRFPAGCVRIMDSESAAIAASQAQSNLYAAVVYGPSKSSEGVEIYYLERWLS